MESTEATKGQCLEEPTAPTYLWALVLKLLGQAGGNDLLMSETRLNIQQAMELKWPPVITPRNHLVNVCFSPLHRWVLQSKGSWFQRDTVSVPLRSKLRKA